MSTPYSPPASSLLTFGDVRLFEEWPNYLELGFSHEHIPDLIRLATDTKLHLADSESAEVWAPVHAWRTLGQLAASEAVEPLLPLFHELDDSDWAGEELPEVYGMIGPAALPALTSYLADSGHEMWPRVMVGHSIERIAAHHPSARPACITALSQQLQQFRDTDPSLNAFLISYLLDLKAVEAAPLMEQAFAANSVDLSIAGDWEDIQVSLGLKAERTTPRPPLHLFPPLTLPAMPMTKAKTSKNTAAAKSKAKRKQAKASRKKNKQRK
jgi:hypothetical protein